MPLGQARKGRADHVGERRARRRPDRPPLHLPAREHVPPPRALRQGDRESPNYDQTMGDFPAELRLFFDLGVNGIFTDDADVAVAVRTAWLADSGGS